MELELISFKLCPFMQPSVITLLHKGIEHKLTYIDINDPPHWFEEISPTGQVPILRLDTSTVIFESAVINEFLNDMADIGMMPSDPVQKALNRSWIQFCGSFFGEIFTLLGSQDEKEVADIEFDIHEKLDRVEAVKSESTFFNGEELNLIDTSFAALFMRLDLLKAARPILDPERYPRLNQWSEDLLSLDVVKESVVPEFPSMYTGMVKMRDGWMAQNIEF